MWGLNIWHRCLDDIKEWMSASKLKLPDKIQIKQSLLYLVQKDRGANWKHIFHLPSWVVLSALLSLSRIWVCGSILTFPCPNMFRMSAKVVLYNSMILDMSGSFLLMMLLYLWPMILLVVGWITVTHFSGVSLSLIFVNYSASKTVQLESYQISVDILA